MTYAQALNNLTPEEITAWHTFKGAWYTLKDDHRQEFINVLITLQKAARNREQEERT